MGKRKSPWRANFAIFLTISLFITEDVYGETTHMSKAEREELKEESRDMFYHAYRAYMENAYPADELMPLSCTGRYKGVTASRGDMDDMLGNFSLTLVDSVDTLVLLGDFEEFEHAVKLIIKDVSFDSDIIVSVFETNIRMLGGLLSAHILAEYLQQRDGIMPWYRGELLDMAKDLGYRLLPAFNTTTGIPQGRVNLRHGMKVPKLQNERETCTACAGTMVLEMAALSRLSGEPIFELKAHKAMDALWKLRHRSSDLMGTVLNVHSGDWVRRDSGVGAGIDSYYEYCLKAYILLGDDKYLNRFNKHYSAIMKYISQGPMLLDVHMHRPHTNSRNFMDAMLAFWPGLQVLSGDLRPAVETHEMLYQIMQRHTFLPEAFTMDFQVVWGQYPLRPEFLESTYFLYKATQDPYYLQVGKKVLKSLQKHARVPCGYASVNDVRTGKHEDRMDSFVLSETFKYLFLLFSDPADLVLDLDEFIFTTEAHFLPLTLGGHVVNGTVASAADFDEADQEFSRTCPTTLKLFPESVRRPLKDLVSGVCIKRDSPASRGFRAKDFQPSNEDHLRIVRDMGITLLTLEDGRVQLLHSFSTARSSTDAEEGLIFMQEMVELSKSQAQGADTMPQAVMFTLLDSEGKPHRKILRAGPSHFGPELRGSQKITARVGVAKPFRVCSDLSNLEQIKGRIVIMERGDCMFVDKARRVQAAGAVAAIVVDNSPGSSSTNSPMFAMSGDGTDDVKIPVVFLFTEDAINLRTAIATNPGIEITLGDMKNIQNLPISANNASKKTKILDLQEAIKRIIALSESVEDIDNNIISLNDFSAKIIDKDGGKFIELSYKGPHKSVINFESLSKENLDIEVWWRRLKRNILRISSKNRTVIMESALQKYFTMINNISKEVLQSTMTFKNIVGWLLNELENERDPESNYAIPRQLFMEAISNNGREQLKARVLGEMFKQLDSLYHVPNQDTIKGYTDDQVASTGADYVERQSDDVVRGDRVYKANKDEL